jgi:hypothetical protein
VKAFDFGGFRGSSSSRPKGLRFVIPFDWAFQWIPFSEEVIQEVTKLSLKFCCNSWGELGDWSMGSWGLTRAYVSGGRRSNRP